MLSQHICLLLTSIPIIRTEFFSGKFISSTANLLFNRKCLRWYRPVKWNAIVKQIFHLFWLTIYLLIDYHFFKEKRLLTENYPDNSIPYNYTNTIIWQSFSVEARCGLGVCFLLLPGLFIVDVAKYQLHSSALKPEEFGIDHFCQLACIWAMGRGKNNCYGCSERIQMTGPHWTCWTHSQLSKTQWPEANLKLTRR